MFRNKRGQGTLEYVIVLAAVIAGIVLFVATQATDKTTGVGKIMETANTQIRGASADVKAIVP